MPHQGERFDALNLLAASTLAQNVAARSDARQVAAVPRQKPPEETKTSVMWNFFVEYMESSTIHGLYHLAAAKRTALENVVWLCLLGLGVTGAYFVGSTTLVRYQQNPTVISIEKNYQDWNTTFPSMTICPVETVDSEKLADLVSRYSDEKTRKAVEQIMIFLAENASFETFSPELLELAPHFPISPEKYVDSIYEITHNFTYVSHDSNGGGFNMTENFSELGNCHAYNSMISVYNSHQYWKSNNWNISTDYGVIKIGNPLDGEIFSTITDMSSLAKVYTHGFNDVPDISSRPRFLLDKEYLEYDLGIWSISSTPETFALSVSQRRCRFLNESDLNISPAYTYKTCRMQCRANKAVELCGCAPHYYRTNPRRYNWPRCNITGYACLKEHVDLLSKMRDVDTGEKVKCECLPPCDDIAFVVHKDKLMPWFLNPTFKLGVTNYPRMRLKRDILFGLTDLFVSIGGTAGLFLGCSVLSFVEIFYFFTLRLFWFIRFRYKQRSSA